MAKTPTEYSRPQWLYLLFLLPIAWQVIPINLYWLQHSGDGLSPHKTRSGVEPHGITELSEQPTKVSGWVARVDSLGRYVECYNQYRLGGSTVLGFGVVYSTGLFVVTFELALCFLDEATQ